MTTISYPGHWKEPYADKGDKYNKIKEMIDELNTPTNPAPPSAHASSHASGQSDALTDVVFNSGNQTVNGIKTFGSIPVLPGSNPSADNQATRKAYVDSVAGGAEAKVLFDMSDFTLATNDIPGFIKYSSAGTTAMDSSTYFKMISSTVLEAKKIAGDPVSQAHWVMCLNGSHQGGVKVTWDWKRSGSWWSASTNFYFSFIFLAHDISSGYALRQTAAGRFSSDSTPSDYDWQIYNGTSYVDSNQIVGTSWTTVEIEIMPQAYPGDAYSIRFRMRTDGGAWTEVYARTDSWTQADDIALAFLGFQMNCGSSSAYWDLEFRNIKVELLDVNWEP